MCAHSTYLQGPEEDSFPTLFLDMSQFARSNGTPIVAKSLENVQPKDGSQVCKCGKETFGCSLHPSGKEEWIASMRDSLARIFRLLETRQVLAKERDRGFTVKSCAALMKYDQATYSWRTYQRSLETEWEQFSEIWPRAGILADGVVYVHPMSELATEEIVGGYWPTPCLPGNGGSNGKRKLKRMIATPKVQDSRHALTRNKNAIQNELKESNLGEYITKISGGGKLNPTWVGWLMGFPIGWTSSKRWETLKSRSKRPSLSKS